jgi:hypothetical protein
MYSGHMWGPEIMYAGALGSIVLLFALWSIFWKGLALWHSAQRGQYWWFVIMLALNTVGILEIVYLFGVAKLKFDTLFTTHVFAMDDKKTAQ